MLARESVAMRRKRKGILYIYGDTGERKEVNRYFAEAEEGWREIDRAEYEQRRQMDADRRAAEKEE